MDPASLYRGGLSVTAGLQPNQLTNFYSNGDHGGVAQQPELEQRGGADVTL